MARNDDEHGNDEHGSVQDSDAHSHDGSRRQEPTFGRFDDDEDYEEPDRDANYTSGYHTDDVNHEEDFDEPYDDDSEPDLFQDEDAEYDDEPSDDDEEEDNAPGAWLASGTYPEEGEEHRQGWPLGLIAVAVVALVLLIAGGYGVMQQRTATEEELRELRAALATSNLPREDGTGLPALEELQLAYDTLAAETDALRMENATLTDTVAGLEAQLGRQQQAKPASAAVVGSTAPTAPTTQPTRVEPKTAAAAPPPVQAAPPQPKPVAPIAPKPSTATQAAATGPWFVNFGSYATREMAASWAARLKPGAGKVIIMPNTSDGRTLYRLRVIGLADRDTAKQVAHKLETELRVAQLWVGKE